jgi:DNA-directed RNA polymerase specialized sigma24 family protein
MDQKTNSEKKKIEKFEDALEIIDTLLEKKSRSWKLKAVNWFDYEDVKQKIRFHIFIKWDKWDRQRPIEPWLNTIISNQIINEIRNKVNIVDIISNYVPLTKKGKNIDKKKEKDVKLTWISCIILLGI